MEESNSTTNLSHEERKLLTRKYYMKKGYRVHSGLQFGCELVLYADIPSRVHSDFCVHIPDGNTLNWMTIQVLVRSMPDLHKTLIIANLKECSPDNLDAVCLNDDMEKANGLEAKMYTAPDNNYYTVDEIAIASEHAPFRHKNVTNEVGVQVKKRKVQQQEE